jgi:site-specific recombinase XerD
MTRQGLIQEKESKNMKHEKRTKKLPLTLSQREFDLIIKASLATGERQIAKWARLEVLKVAAKHADKIA